MRGIETAGVGHNSMAQSVFRAHGDRGYTKLRNEFLQDNRISDETRGLVARLLSRPTDWHFTVKEIIASGPSGRDKVYRMMKEAEQYGYIAPEKPRRGNGTYSAHVYLVTDDPQVLIHRAAEEILALQSGLHHANGDATSWKAGGGEKANGIALFEPLPEKPEVAYCPLPDNPDTANPEVVQNSPLPAQPLPAQPLPAKPTSGKPDTTNKRVLQTNDETKVAQPEPVERNSALDFMLNADAPKAEDPEYRRDFEEWWAVYPRKTGKGACAGVWERLTAGQRKRAMAGLRVQLPVLIARANDIKGNFCPHPRTWLQQGRYDDDVGAAVLAAPPASHIPPRGDDCPEAVWQARLKSYVQKGLATQDEAEAAGLVA